MCVCALIGLNYIYFSPFSLRIVAEDDGQDTSQTAPSYSQPAPGSVDTSPTPPRKRGRARTSTSKANEVLSPIGQRLTSTKQEDEQDLFGRTVAYRKREEQNKIAEKLINDVLFDGRMSQLNYNSRLVNAIYIGYSLTCLLLFYHNSCALSLIYCPSIPTLPCMITLMYLDITHLYEFSSLIGHRGLNTYIALLDCSLKVTHFHVLLS